MGLGWIRRAFLFVIILIFVIILLHYWLLTKDYVFTEEAVATIAKKYAQEDPQMGINIKEAYKRIHVEMKSKYPRHILPEENLQWIFMNAGGWMGSICLLHASLTEYVLFFGTNVNTVGHSGRYWANISDTILTGTFRQWKEGSLDVNVFGPGDTVLHVWGEATAVDFKAGLWMVEYGRGIIPSTLGFALADTLFSTQDFISMFRIFTVYGYALLQEAANVFTSLTDFFEDNAY